MAGSAGVLTTACAMSAPAGRHSLSDMGRSDPLRAVEQQLVQLGVLGRDTGKQTVLNRRSPPPVRKDFAHERAFGNKVDEGMDIFVSPDTGLSIVWKTDLMGTAEQVLQSFLHCIEHPAVAPARQSGQNPYRDNRLKRDRAPLETLGRHSQRVQQAGNVLSAERNVAEAATSAEAADVVHQLSTTHGSMSDRIKASAQEVSNGNATLTQAIDQGTETVREWVAEGGATGRGAARAGEGAAAPADQGVPSDVAVEDALLQVAWHGGQHRIPGQIHWGNGFAKACRLVLPAPSSQYAVSVPQIQVTPAEQALPMREHVQGHREVSQFNVVIPTCRYSVSSRDRVCEAPVSASGRRQCAAPATTSSLSSPDEDSDASPARHVPAHRGPARSAPATSTACRERHTLPQGPGGSRG